jgi:hypothetical protein
VRRISSRTSSSSRPSHRKRYAEQPRLCHASQNSNWQQIGELKAKIQSDKGWEVPQQKLIYSGELASAARNGLWHFGYRR